MSCLLPRYHPNLCTAGALASSPLDQPQAECHMVLGAHQMCLSRSTEVSANTSLPTTPPAIQFNVADGRAASHSFGGGEGLGPLYKPRLYPEAPLLLGWQEPFPPWLGCWLSQWGEFVHLKLNVRLGM